MPTDEDPVEKSRLDLDDNVAASTELIWLQEIDSLEENLELIVLMLAPPS
jgi:hypothetical protein